MHKRIVFVTNIVIVVNTWAYFWDDSLSIVVGIAVKYVFTYLIVTLEAKAYGGGPG